MAKHAPDADGGVSDEQLPKRAKAAATASGGARLVATMQQQYDGRRAAGGGLDLDSVRAVWCNPAGAAAALAVVGCAGADLVAWEGGVATRDALPAGAALPAGVLSSTELLWRHGRGRNDNPHDVAEFFFVLPLRSDQLRERRRRRHLLLTHALHGSAEPELAALQRKLVAELGFASCEVRCPQEDPVAGGGLCACVRVRVCVCVCVCGGGARQWSR